MTSRIYLCIQKIYSCNGSETIELMRSNHYVFEPRSEMERDFLGLNWAEKSKIICKSTVEVCEVRKSLYPSKLVSSSPPQFMPVQLASMLPPAFPFAKAEAIMRMAGNGSSETKQIPKPAQNSSGTLRTGGTL
ncbi:hypothetical protein LguiB_018788 [Lonicera macranthoides]